MPQAFLPWLCVQAAGHMTAAALPQLRSTEDSCGGTIVGPEQRAAKFKRLARDVLNLKRLRSTDVGHMPLWCHAK